jgi:hypothetical protein
MAESRVAPQWAQENTSGSGERKVYEIRVKKEVKRGQRNFVTT